MAISKYHEAIRRSGACVYTVEQQIESWKSAITERERYLRHNTEEREVFEAELAFCHKRLAETEAQLKV